MKVGIIYKLEKTIRLFERMYKNNMDSCNAGKLRFSLESMYV